MLPIRKNLKFIDDSTRYDQTPPGPVLDFQIGKNKTPINGLN